MKEKFYALFGMIGPSVAFSTIGVAIALSPWFSWQRNALSDLGHATRSGVAPIYNVGLLLAGFFITIYAAILFRKYAKFTSISLVVSACLLQLVATFDEIYGHLHGAVSVMFFVAIGVTTVIYAIEKRSFLAIVAFIVVLCSWILYGLKVYSAGVAVPEAVSSLAVTAWLIHSAIGVFSSE